jgi:hypothetical protein
MPVDVDAAEQFMYANARLLERRRLAVLLYGEPIEPVLAALKVYRNADGGFGHALEPDVRCPSSEPVATLHALEVLADVGALADPVVDEAIDWVASISDPDAGVPFVLPAAAAYPHAPWMVPSDGGSHLTFALAAVLSAAGSDSSWVPQAIDWCWQKLERPEDLNAYWVKYALSFLDKVRDKQRAAAAVESLRPLLDSDGSLPVAGGTENERLTPLALSPRPGALSRALFTEDQIGADLDELESGQLDDGGWMFDWLAWSPAQAVEWRGIVTLEALTTLVSCQVVPPTNMVGSGIL